jgi:hypothetical protein
MALFKTKTKLEIQKENDELKLDSSRARYADNATVSVKELIKNTAVEDDGLQLKFLIDYVVKRLKKRLGIIMIYTGGTGLGKSTAGLSFAETWYEYWFNEKFPISHVTQDLMHAIMKVKDFKRPGEVIIIEEMSTLIGSRESSTQANRVFNQFLDTCRLKQAIIIGNAPHLNSLDKHFRRMCQVQIEMLGINFRKKLVFGQPKWFNPVQWREEPYHNSFFDKDGNIIDYCTFKKPERELMDEYDKFKQVNFERLMEEIALKMKATAIKQMKNLGQKIFNEQETKVLETYINGWEPEYSLKHCDLEKDGVEKYNDVLKQVKKKLIMPEYQAHFSKIKSELLKEDGDL